MNRPAFMQTHHLFIHLLFFSIHTQTMALITYVTKVLIASIVDVTGARWPKVSLSRSISLNRLIQTVMHSINSELFFNSLLLFWRPVVSCSYSYYIEVLTSAPAVQGANVTFEAHLKDENGYAPAFGKLDWVCYEVFLLSFSPFCHRCF